MELRDNTPVTLRSLAGGDPLPRNEQRLLWQHVLGVSHSWLIAHDTDPVASSSVRVYQRLAQRRLAGEPMAYLLGEREFMGHSFKVSPAVLIPRPDTEVLVEVALACLPPDRPASVLDLGTGSGAIAVSVALARPNARVVATDASAEALAIARQNAASLGASVTFLQGSWYDALDDNAAFDLIVSNPPYIARLDTHLQQGDLRFEPRLALTDEHDGLQALRAIVDGAQRRLNRSGALYVEHGWDQAAAVRQLCRQAGLHDVRSIRDLAGIERVTGGIYN